MEKIVERLRYGLSQAKIVGDSPAFRKATQQFPSIAASDAAVLVVGETGTGKELASRAIHYMSRRASFPFVPVNCGALPDSLFESELFGHEKGAFTGAHSRRAGLIVQADKGTLFLDEIDSLSSKAQVALLRVLQDQRFRTIGGVRESTVDVRIIAATNQSIEDLVASGKFRQDLFYRLCVFSVFLPPLRERKEDILLLANHFIQKHSHPETTEKSFAVEAAQALMTYEWPGNVRELENAVIRGVHLSKSSKIHASNLEISPLMRPTNRDSVISDSKIGSFKTMKRKVIEAFEMDYLTRLMQKHAGNVTVAAKAAGKERRDLGRLLKKHGLNPQQYRS